MSVKLESTHVSALDTAHQSRRAAAPSPRQPATSFAGHPSRTLSIAASGLYGAGAGAPGLRELQSDPASAG
jgi:hypothetical protein